MLGLRDGCGMVEGWGIREEGGNLGFGALFME